MSDKKCPICGTPGNFHGSVTQYFEADAKMEKLRSELDCVESWKDRAEKYSEDHAATILALIAERDAARAEIETLRAALRMYSSDAMRIGSTVTPKWADEALNSECMLERNGM